MIHIRFYTLHESSKELTEVFILINIDKLFKKRDIKEIFYNFKVFILITFIIDFLETIGKIIIINDQMTFLM